MKKVISKLLFFCLTLYFNTAFTQGRSNYWPMGYQSFTQFSFVGGITVDFPFNIFNFYDYPREQWTEFTNAAICNDTGALLFYTNGVYIANAQDDTMLNGSGINPSFYTTKFYQDGLRLPQADIIIPKPDNDSLYYLFHQTKDIKNGTFTRGKFFYNSIINMKGDSGRGEVILKNDIILNDTLFVGAVSACKHANGRDWWLLVPEYGVNIGYYIWLITPDTFQVFSHNYYTINGLDIGQSCFASDGSKYLLSFWWGVAFFDFDRCSGSLTLLDSVMFPNNNFCVGASISPNSRYAYVGVDGGEIFQFDLQAANIPLSKISVAVFDGFQAPSNTSFWLHQIAIDGKIYIITTNPTYAMHVINEPDSVGLNCDVQQHAIILPHLSASIPNLPNYDLGRLQGSPCDTLQWASNPPTPDGGAFAVRLNPNPANNSFYINYDIHTNQNLLFILYDSFGNEVLRKNLYGVYKNLLVHSEGLSNGVYFYTIQPMQRNGKSPKGDLGVWRTNGKLVVIH